MIRIKKIIQQTAIIAVLGGFFACQRDSQYHKSESIPVSGWEMNQTLYFQDSLKQDAPEQLCLSIELRHNNLYPYQNLWLYVRTRCSNGFNRLDSINWKLSEPNGRWVGDGWGSLYHLTYKLQDINIPKSNNARWFVVEIQHGLNDPVLKGIESIGVHVFTNKNN